MGKDQDILRAVRDNDHATLHKLLQKVAKQAKTKIIGNSKKLNINFQDGDGLSALHHAALMSNVSVLQILLDNGASQLLKDNKGMTALHYAAWQGVTQPVQILLVKGAVVNEQGVNGDTPLHLACLQGHFDVVSLLLSHHADPTISNKELRTSLDLACQSGHSRVVELLLRSSLCQKLLEDSPTDLLDSSRTTCLHLAARNGHIDVIRLLLQAGMNINRVTPRGSCLHEATQAGHSELVRLLLEHGADVHRLNSYNQSALDMAQKLTSPDTAKEITQLLKDASCPIVYARAVCDYSSVYEPTSLRLKEGDIVKVLEQRPDGVWRGCVCREGHTTRPGLFPASSVVLLDCKLTVGLGDLRPPYGQVPDILHTGSAYLGSHHPNSNIGGHPHSNTGGHPQSNIGGHPHSNIGGHPHSNTGGHPQSNIVGHPHINTGGHPHSNIGGHPYSSSGSHSYSIGSSVGGSSAMEVEGHPTPYIFPSTPSIFPVPASSMLASYPPRSPLNTGPERGGSVSAAGSGGTDSGFSSLHSLPQYTPSSPAATQQLGKSPFLFGPTLSAGSSAPTSSSDHQRLLHHQHHGEWSAAPTPLPALGSDMRGSSPAKDSPGHSNRNSSASSDSGRGCSTGHSDTGKPASNHVSTAQSSHRLSGQSCESGVSCRQSYQSSSSSSHGSLDLIEEPSPSCINVTQLYQAGLPDNEVLQAWLHDLHFEEYLPLFLQAGYDLPTISRMTPEDLTAVGITKPAHRKRLKTEIARFNIPDGIPDFRPNDLMEWLHLLGLGDYWETLCGQGYDCLDYVTDITWEDLEEIGIRKLGHQKKIILAIDRLKRLSSGVKHQSLVDGRTASLELLEPPPPAPPITGRWTEVEAGVLPPYLQEGALAHVGDRPKKSPSGDSLSTTASGASGSSIHYSTGSSAGSLGEAGVLAGALPHHLLAATGTQPDLVAVQMKKNVRSSSTDDNREADGPQIMYHSFQGSTGKSLETETFLEGSKSLQLDGSGYTSTGGMERYRPVAKVLPKSDTKYEQDADSSSAIHAQKVSINNNNNKNSLRVDVGEHIYDMPQLSPSPKSPKPAIMPKPTHAFGGGIAGPMPVPASSEAYGSNQANSPLGGKRGKKVPPPPPIRTHSIRSESTSDSAPSSPSKSPVLPAVITVAASVHLPPSSLSAKPQPPPVLQKPSSPAVTNKLHLQHKPDNPQVQQSYGSPISQKQKPLSPKVTILPSSHNQSAQNSPQTAQDNWLVFSKPQTAVVQPKSPLPVKSPVTPIITPLPKHQQQLAAQHMLHHQSLPQALPKMQLPPSQPPGSTPLPAKAQATVLPTQHQAPGSTPQPSHLNQPQVQAFASCVKSLSEKFGKGTQEDDQFPDNVSTDSDDFPPPPPPIAMDIITPKIHNYGIPSSRERGKPEFGLQHQRDYTQRARQLGTTGVSGMPGLQQKLGPKNLGHFPAHLMPASVVMTSSRTQQNEHLAGIQFQKEPGKSGSDRELTPELDPMNAISKDKRSESTTSFESNASSSSIDSNTLPFANENVGTIKQRVVNVKPSVVDSEYSHPSQSEIQSIRDLEIHRSIARGPNSPLYVSHRTQDSNLSRNEVVNRSITQPPQSGNLNQLLSQSSPVAPVVSQKPSLSPKPTRAAQAATPEPASASSHPQGQQLQSPQDSNPQPGTVRSDIDKSSPQTGNVLSDIDNMLQGLTDELDAMLEESLTS